MSWDAYITNLTAAGNIQEAAICTGDSIWAKTPAFDIKVEEVKALAASRESMYTSGVKLAGQKYRLLRYNFDDSIDPSLTLKSAKDEQGRSCNATVYKTKTAYVIGVGSPDAQGGAVNTDVCKIGAYLLQSNY